MPCGDAQAPSRAPRGAAGEVGVGLRGGQPLDRPLQRAPGAAAPATTGSRAPRAGWRPARGPCGSVVGEELRRPRSSMPLSSTKRTDGARRASRWRAPWRSGSGRPAATASTIATQAAAGRVERRAHIAIATYLISRYSSMPSAPPSRPKPDCLDAAERRRRVGDEALVEADHAGLRAPRRRGTRA